MRHFVSCGLDASLSVRPIIKIEKPDLSSPSVPTVDPCRPGETPPSVSSSFRPAKYVYG